MISKVGFEFVLSRDKNSHWVKFTFKIRRIDTAFDIWDLRSSEGNYFILEIVTEVDVEVMKLPASCARNEHTSSFNS